MTLSRDTITRRIQQETGNSLQLQVKFVEVATESQGPAPNMLSPGRIVRSQQLSLRFLQQRSASRSLADYSHQREHQCQRQQQRNDAEHRSCEEKDKSQKPSESAQQHSGSSESKSTGQADEELRENLEKMMSNDAGVELEGGKPIGLKRGVRNNMFRLI